MKNLTLTTAVLLPWLAATAAIPAQTYHIPWHRIGPGGTHRGGAYSVNGSAGQFEAGTMSGGSFGLSGGFWVFPSTPSGPASTYTFVALDTPPLDYSLALAINNFGQIVGGDSVSPAFWTNSSSPVAKLLAPYGGVASGINNSGQIVGEAGQATPTRHAAFWANTASSGLDLGTFGPSDRRRWYQQLWTNRRLCHWSLSAGRPWVRLPGRRVLGQQRQLSV